MRIKKEYIFVIFIYFLILSSYGNVVLRLNIESDLTLFRVVGIIAFCVFFIKYTDIMIKWSVLYIIFFIYSFFLASLYTYDYSQFYPSMIHYGYLLLLFISMYILKMIKKDNFERDYYIFLKMIMILILLILLLEYIFDFNMPNLYEDFEYSKSIRAFFWNQNDLAVVLVFFSWIIMYNQKVRFIIKVLYIFIVLIIMYYNGSKVAILALLFSFIFVSINFIVKKFREGFLLSLLYIMLILLFIILIFIFFGDIQFKSTDGIFTINELLFRPFISIITLQPTGEFWGSNNNRIDAAIFVLIEYIGSYFIGLGAGGSWLVLLMPQYELGGAKSPHNALLQFIVDFGYLIIIPYLILFFYAIKNIFKKNNFILTKINSVAILSFPILGLSQSGSIVTNYLFWSFVFFLILSDKQQFQKLFYKERE